MEKKIGMELSGCGVYDGSEMYEAVFNSAEAICMAPDILLDEADHVDGRSTSIKR